jgi:hypothetical protein
MPKIARLLVTRNECREMGMNVSNTTFQRWERASLLQAFKPNGRNSIVRYRLRDVLRLIASRTEHRGPLDEDLDGDDEDNS